MLPLARAVLPSDDHVRRQKWKTRLDHFWARIASSRDSAQEQPSPTSSHAAPRIQRPDTSEYRYEPLDPAASEIRVLRFIDATTTDQHDLVHCTLHHVSLDDLLPEFREFQRKKDLKMDAAAAKSWLSQVHKIRLTSRTASKSEVSYWRSWLERGSTHVVFEKLVNMNAFGSSEIKVVDRLIQAKARPERPRTTAIVSRFNWGDFEAISYCWESDIRNKVAVVNGRTISLPSNLESLLQRLQHLPDAKSGMAFWVDGLCINQDNVLEKNHQVKLMKRIYTEALSVVVWLGEQDDTSNQAIDFLLKLACQSDLGSDRLGADNETEYLEAVLRLCSRGYFTRMWVIQELALNHHLSMFMCGGRQFPRSALTRMTERLRQSSEVFEKLFAQHAAGSSSLFLSHSVWRTGYTVGLLLFLGKDGNLPGADYVLDLARRSQVTHAQDKVYGLLGLLPDDLAQLIVPDYSATPQQVFSNFACALLRYTSSIGLQVRGLRIDKIASTSAKSSDYLPYGQASDPVFRDRSTTTTYGRYGSSAGLYWAFNRTLLHAHPDYDKTRPLSDIYWVGDRYGRNDERRQTFTTFMESEAWHTFERFRQTNAHFSLFGRSFESMFNSFHPNDEIHNGPLAHGICRVQRITRTQSGTGPALVGSPFALDARHKDQMKLATVGLQGRRLITTASGHLGLAPDEAEAGDTVAVLYGCNYPVVLRACGAGHRYVGECYLDGGMHGQAIGGRDRGEYTEEEIVLV
ncbi:hypothetical protein ACN47E_002805 [Coniothyrium glycines]